MRFTKFKQLRLERTLLQVEVAQRAQIDRARLSLIENAHTAATAVELARIARVLRVPLAILFDATRERA